MFNTTRAVIVLALGLVVASSLTCGGESITPPANDEVANIEVLSGSGQTGPVGQPLPSPIRIRVTDGNGQPVAGARIAFDVDPSEPGASVSPDTTRSGSTGEATSIWTLPTAAGPATARGHVVGAPDGQLTAQFSATAAAATPETILIVGGQDQAGLATAQLPESLKVQVTDHYDNPVADFPVSWVASGGGTVSPTQTKTDADGFATAARTLGDGTQTMTTQASASGLNGSPVTFNHRVVRPAAVAILTQPSSTAASGTPFQQQPVVEVRDANGAVINGIQVVASVESGGGNLNGNTTATTSGGTATFTNLALSGAGQQVLRFSAGSAFATSSPITVTVSQGTDQGEWSSPVAMPLVAIHVSLLPNGKVLMFSRTTQPFLWDPANPGSFTPLPVGTNVFCSGHTLMADGRVFVAGGHIADFEGLPDGNIFDPVGNNWTRLPNMLVGRWYPTTTVLPNGEILVLGGTDETQAYAETPEIWTGSGWRRLTGTGVPRPLPYYPRMFVAPNGKTFFAGPWDASRYFDQSGDGKWEPVIRRLDGDRNYGSAVMYEPGKIIYIGGGDPPKSSSEIIDLNQPAPSWSLTGSMAFKRRHMNATILPDGQILATGGTSSPGFNNAAGSVHTAEMWNPATGRWTIMAASAVDRVYHSTALLLPDGRVLLSGSGEGGGGVNQRTYEFFSPPYLFRGARPTISAAPASVSYGGSFLVQTPDAAKIQKISLIRLGSVTHAFDESQRFMTLNFSVLPGQLSVTAPANANLAQPGHYLLTIVDGAGIPSISKIVRVQ